MASAGVGEKWGVWEKGWDPRKERAFYKNHLLKTTQWEDPRPLPPGLQEKEDPRTKRKYYSDDATKTTSWVDPRPPWPLVYTPSQETGWTCGKFTFTNKQSRNLCEMCNAPRSQQIRAPVVAVSRQKFTKNTKTWTCSNCTFENKGGSRVCDMCKTRRLGRKQITLAPKVEAVDTNTTDNTTDTNTTATSTSAFIPSQEKKPAWNCGSCTALNYYPDIVCYRCNVPEGFETKSSNATNDDNNPPVPVSSQESSWNCRSCNTLNSPNEKACYKCETSKEPPPETKIKVKKIEKSSDH